MGRGGATKERDGPERRCLVSGAVGPTAPLVRFVLSPDGEVVPDVAEKLPGRGVWVSPRREALAKAVSKRLFSRGFRTQANARDDLPETVERLLAKRSVDAVSICRKAGQAVAGFEKCRDKLRSGAPIAAVVQAHDGAPDGKRKLKAVSDNAATVEALGRFELGLAFGRPYVIHAVLTDGGAARRAARELGRLAALRGFDEESRPTTSSSTYDV